MRPSACTDIRCAGPLASRTGTIEDIVYPCPRLEMMPSAIAFLYLLFVPVYILLFSSFVLLFLCFLVLPLCLVLMLTLSPFLIVSVALVLLALLALSGPGCRGRKEVEGEWAGFLDRGVHGPGHR